MTRTRVLAGLLMLSSLGANAANITYALNYSGADFGNAAMAVGSVTLNTDLLPNESGNLFGQSGDALGVVDFQLTVLGTAGSDGSFDQSDLGADGGRWVWTLANAIDLNAELVGQAGFLDFNWLCEINNAQCNNALVPQGVAAFQILTLTGELMTLTSMRPVPLPGGVWLLGSALCGLVLRSRRRLTPV